MTLPAPFSEPWSSNSYQVYVVEGTDNVIPSAQRIEKASLLLAN
jgi:hypothetical protein